MKMSKMRSGAIVAGLALVFSALAPTTAIADTGEVGTLELNGIITDAPVSTPAELDAYILSSNEKTMKMDTETGEILEVWEGADETIRPLIVWQNSCLPGNLCLNPYRTPHLAYGFAGNGTASGAWANMGSWSTGQWTGRVTVGFGATSPFVGPGTTVVFSQVPSQVTRVQIR